MGATGEKREPLPHNDCAGSPDDHDSPPPNPCDDEGDRGPGRLSNNQTTVPPRPPTVDDHDRHREPVDDEEIVGQGRLSDDDGQGDRHASNAVRQRRRR